jgi:hypothetical protein
LHFAQYPAIEKEDQLQHYGMKKLLNPSVQENGTKKQYTAIQVSSMQMQEIG